MPLSNEDNLRLNVLMSQDVKAIRIDEGKMLLYALKRYYFYDLVKKDI